MTNDSPLSPRAAQHYVLTALRNADVRWRTLEQVESLTAGADSSPSLQETRDALGALVLRGLVESEKWQGEQEFRLWEQMNRRP